MLAKIFSVAHFGLEPIKAEIEVDIASKGFPSLTIVGLPSKAIEESKERLRAALANSGFEIPQRRITINLAPADVPKEGSCYDLPIAIGILCASKQFEISSGDSLFYGEVGLDGHLRHTNGVFLLATFAKENGFKKIFIPDSCSNEALVIRGLEVYPVSSLENLINHFLKIKPIEKVIGSKRRISAKDDFEPEFDMGEIIGQEQAKRVLEIAAAGGHNLLLKGPPGAGKTMLARALPGILPPLKEEEAIEVTKIYSLTGNIPPGGSIIRRRPFRAPHHTTSRIGLIGGGSKPQPGEVSLAHRGVLFLDEFAEFPRNVLEALRQPMEDGWVTVSRAAGSFTFPARFSLVAASNPCPCGFLTHPNKPCRCSAGQVIRYQRRLSGPIMDRIDLHVELPPVDPDKLTARDKYKCDDSKTIRKRVIEARKIQHQRFKKTKAIANAEIKGKEIIDLCNIEPQAFLLLKQAITKFQLSARSYYRILKVSRTIADLAKGEKVLVNHVAEALQYRPKD